MTSGLPQIVFAVCQTRNGSLTKARPGRPGIGHVRPSYETPLRGAVGQLDWRVETGDVRT